MSDQLDRRPRGRKKYFTQQRRDKAIEMAKRGCSLKEISKGIGVDIRTFRFWRLENPTFEDELLLAQQATTSEVVAALFNTAMGYEFEEQEITEVQDADGNIIKKSATKRRRHATPNVAAQKYILNNRRPDRWFGDKVDRVAGDLQISVTLPGMDNDTSQLPENWSVEELNAQNSKLIDVKAEKVEEDLDSTED